MLDFRFLIGTLLAGIVLAMTALRMFGPVEPLHAARPDLETAAVPRQQLTPAFVRTSSGSPPRPTPLIVAPAKIAAPKIPPPPESVSRNQVKDLPVQVEARSDPDETTGAVEPAAQAATESPAVKPKPRAIAAARKRENETPEFGEFNLFRLLFPQNAGQKSQGANRPPALQTPFTQ